VRHFITIIAHGRLSVLPGSIVCTSGLDRVESACFSDPRSL